MPVHLLTCLDRARPLATLLPNPQPSSHSRRYYEGASYLSGCLQLSKAAPSYYYHGSRLLQISRHDKTSGTQDITMDGHYNFPNVVCGRVVREVLLLTGSTASKPSHHMMLPRRRDQGRWQCRPMRPRCRGWWRGENMNVHPK